jgi:predicted phage terminase large subunit-like protein
LNVSLARLPTLAEIQLERRRRSIEASRERCTSFHAFVIEAWHVLEPETEFVDGWHVQAICQHLEAVTDGRITRLLINVPPGSMKSLLVSVLWPAWEWGPRNLPGKRYISTSFNEDNVSRDTRKTRDLIQSEWYQARWPGVRLKKAGETSFSNTRSGTRDGVPFNSLTSKRADRLLIDDPHSTKTAESDAERASTVKQFREGAINRLNNQATSALIVIMQRLHEQDVSGTILELMSGQYVHLCLPMEFDASKPCRTRIGFEDPRTEDGELLCPQRFSRETVETDFKVNMGSYAYAGQYQQRPTPRGGGMFKRVWFEGGLDDEGKTWPPRMINANLLPADIVWWRHWDLAGTKRKASDTKGARTAGVLMGRSRKTRLFYVRDCVAKAIEGGWPVRELLFNIAEADGKEVRVSLPKDPGQAGKAQGPDFVSLLAGYIVHVEREQGSKEDRAEPFASQCEAGNVFLVEGPWNSEFLDELCLFPNGARKDIPDACSGAFGRLVGRQNDSAEPRVAAPIIVTGVKEVDGYE